MSTATFDAIAGVLVDSFQVGAERIHANAPLDSLGLDSLALMEFVFAVEDRFDVRIPEDRLDPRQAGVTLASLAESIDDAVRSKAKTPVPSADAAG